MRRRYADYLVLATAALILALSTLSRSCSCAESFAGDVLPAVLSFSDHIARTHFGIPYREAATAGGLTLE